MPFCLVDGLADGRFDMIYTSMLSEDDPQIRLRSS